MIRVLITDSNQLQSHLLVAALRRRADFQVLSCETDLETILQAMQSADPHVIVMTAERKSGAHNLSVVRRVHLARPHIPQVLLLDSYDRTLVVNAFRSGVRGLFCFSDSPFRLLCKCIQCVHAGQIWANMQQLEYLIDTIAQVPSLRVVNAIGMKLLTPREEQVVALVADGLNNRAIADELNLSQHTIKKYLFRIFDKLGIDSRVELVLYAVSNGDPRPAEWLAGAQA